MFSFDNDVLYPHAVVAIIGDIKMNLREKLIEDTRAFARKKGISEARVTAVVLNNGKLPETLTNGGTCTIETFDRLQAAFKSRKVWEEAKALDRERHKTLNGRRMKRKGLRLSVPEI